MNKKKNVVILLIVFMVLIAGATFLYDKLSENVENEKIAIENENTEEEKKDAKAPDFKVLDQDGNEIAFSEMQQKPIVINFWASWCGYCVSEFPEFEEAYQLYGEDVQFMMINMTDGSRETVESAMSCIDEKGYTFPIYFDVTYDAASVYSVSSLPATYFIDEDGNIVANAIGAIDAENLKKGIEMIYSSENNK